MMKLLKFSSISEENPNGVVNDRFAFAASSLRNSCIPKLKIASTNKKCCIVVCLFANFFAIVITTRLACFDKLLK